MRRKTVPLSAFGKLLERLCQERGTTAYQVGLKAGVKSKAAMTYYMRAKGSGGRANGPPLDRIEALADALGVSGAEREALLVAGNLEHTSDWFKRYVARLEQAAARATK